MEDLIDKAKEISQRTLGWDWLCANFKKYLRRQRGIILLGLRLGVGFYFWNFLSNLIEESGNLNRFWGADKFYVSGLVVPGL